jgi:hypothetical protein
MTTRGKNLPTNLVGWDFLDIRNSPVLRLRNQATETQQERTRYDDDELFSHNHFSGSRLREQTQYWQPECPTLVRLFVGFSCGLGFGVAA